MRSNGCEVDFKCYDSGKELKDFTIFVMGIVKKRNEEIANSLLLESSQAVELPPAEIDESAAVTLHFETFEPFVPEVLEELRSGTIAETVPVIKDGSTFAIHGRTKTFWVKIWHRPDSEMTIIERLQILNCLPSMRNVRIIMNREFDE